MDVSRFWASRYPGWVFLWVNVFGIFACKSPKAPDKEVPESAVSTKYREASERLTSQFVENGWVVSRNSDGAPQHIGEGLIWTGLALSALPCDLGGTLEGALISTIGSLEGALVRYLPLGEYAGGREVTLDGALGLYRGIAERITRCGKGDLWWPIIRMHLVYLRDHNSRLNAQADAVLGPHFDYLLDLLASHVGLMSEPDESNLRDLEGEVAAWAALVNAQHSPCYRINLGYIALSTAEELGKSVNWMEYCAATRGTGIPIVEHRCGRGDLLSWIDSFEPNKWEYRFQRCGGWESPDGNDDMTPGLDLLVAMRAAYDLGN